MIFGGWMLRIREDERLEKVEGLLNKLERYAEYLNKEKIELKKRVIRKTQALERYMQHFEDKHPSLKEKIESYKSEGREFKQLVNFAKAIFHILELIEREFDVEESFRKDIIKDKEPEKRERHMGALKSNLRTQINIINRELLPWYECLRESVQNIERKNWRERFVLRRFNHKVNTCIDIIHKIGGLIEKELRELSTEERVEEKEKEILTKYPGLQPA